MRTRTTLGVRPSGSTPLTVASVPSSHVYVRHLTSETGPPVVRLPDPHPDDRGRSAEQRWWPPYHQHHSTESPPVRHLDAILRNGRTFADRWGTWPMLGWLEEFERAGLVRRCAGGWERTTA